MTRYSRATPSSYLVQGSNILDGFSKKMIKEDHYLACTTKMFENTQTPKRLGCVPFRLENGAACSSRPRRTPAPLDTHPRGLSDYLLVKELSCKR